MYNIRVFGGKPQQGLCLAVSFPPSYSHTVPPLSSFSPTPSLTWLYYRSGIASLIKKHFLKDWSQPVVELLVSRDV